MLPTEPIFSSQSQCFDQYFLCFLICAISPRVGWTTRSNPTSIALIGRLGTLKAPNKGCRITPEFRFESVNPLICYHKLTTPHQIHKIPTCNWRSRDTTILDNTVRIIKSPDVLSMPVEVSKAKLHQHDPRGKTHERKTACRRNRPFLPSLLCV